MCVQSQHHPGQWRLSDMNMNDMNVGDVVIDEVVTFPCTPVISWLRVSKWSDTNDHFAKL